MMADLMKDLKIKINTDTSDLKKQIDKMLDNIPNRNEIIENSEGLFVHYHECLIQAINDDDKPKEKACIVAMSVLANDMAALYGGYDKYDLVINYIYEKYGLGAKFIKSLAHIKLIEYAEKK